MAKNLPPPKFAAYPRSRAKPGGAARLEALASAYFGMNKVFAANILLFILTSFAIAGLEKQFNFQWAFVPCFLVMAAVIAWMSYRTLLPTKDAGMDTSHSAIIVMSIILGLQSFLCCGMPGILVMQWIIQFQIRSHFGLDKTSFGLSKKQVQAEIERQREAEQTSAA